LIYIILLNWNGINYTTHCISSILKQDYSPIKTFVADQGSTDGSLDLLRNAPTEWIDLIEFRNNLGFSVGYNKLIEWIKSRYPDPDFWFFLNNDTKLFPDACSKLVECLRADYKHGIAGLDAYDYKTGEKLPGYGGWIRRDDSKLKIDGFGKYWTDGFAGYKLGMENQPWFEDDYESGCCMMVKSHVLNQIWDKYGRWFDPIYNPLYEEDVDICCEVRLIGNKVFHVNKSGFYHVVSPIAKENRSYWWGIHLENKQKFIQKWAKSIDKGMI